jgi:hypothetical protein
MSGEMLCPAQLLIPGRQKRCNCRSRFPLPEFGEGARRSSGVATGDEAVDFFSRLQIFAFESQRLLARLIVVLYGTPEGIA